MLLRRVVEECDNAYVLDNPAALRALDEARKYLDSICPHGNDGRFWQFCCDYEP
jgi:hypothetical protein